MKQYKISFYNRSKFIGAIAVYYREFENIKDANEWAKDTMKNNVYSDYRISEIPLAEYLQNV